MGILHIASQMIKDTDKMSDKETTKFFWKCFLGIIVMLGCLWGLGYLIELFFNHVIFGEWCFMLFN